MNGGEDFTNPGKIQDSEARKLKLECTKKGRSNTNPEA
jgi:hypothetical protein